MLVELSTANRSIILPVGGSRSIRRKRNQRTDAEAEHLQACECVAEGSVSGLVYSVRASALRLVFLFLTEARCSSRKRWYKSWEAQIYDFSGQFCQAWQGPFGISHSICTLDSAVYVLGGEVVSVNRTGGRSIVWRARPPPLRVWCGWHTPAGATLPGDAQRLRQIMI